MARIAFIQPLYLENNAVTLLSAVLQEHGHETEVFIEDSKLLLSLSRYRPDMACFSMTTGLHGRCLQTAAQVKSAFPVTVVFGGPHPTFFPEIISYDQVDVVCRGEGEKAIVALAGMINEKSPSFDGVPNIWYKRDRQIIRNELSPLIEDLDSLPFPHRDIFYSKYPSLNLGRKEFLTSRGCPYQCSFCFNHAYLELYREKGKMLRRRSPENVLKEILEVREKYKLTHVSFPDDTFNLDREWLFRFLALYAGEVKLPFTCNVRADLVDEETVRMLKEAGCFSANFGIESGNDHFRLKVLKKSLAKEKIVEAAALLKKYGVHYKTFNILGLPGETLESAFETVNLNAAIKTDFPWCSLYQPYPGTELGMEAMKKYPCADINTPSFFDKSPLKQEQARELENLHKFFYLAVKFPQLQGVIRQIIKLPPNPIFKMVFSACFAWQSLFSEGFSFRDFLRVGSKNARRFFMV